MVAQLPHIKQVRSRYSKAVELNDPFSHHVIVLFPRLKPGLHYFSRLRVISFDTLRNPNKLHIVLREMIFNRFDHSQKLLHMMITINGNYQDLRLLVKSVIKRLNLGILFSRGFRNAF